MKNIYTALAIVCAAQLGAATTATLSLKDGSTLKGEFKAERIDCSAAFAKEMPLDPSIVKSLTFAGTNGEAKVVLSNGDRLTVTVSNPDFPVSSVLGELKIPLANIRSMNLSTIKPGAASGELVFHCTFDDPASIASPTIGPKGLYISGTFKPGKDGMALEATVYKPNAAFNLPANFFSKSGCIEFWAKIEPNSPYVGSGGCPRLFTLTQTSTGNTVGGIDIVSNNGVGNSGVCAGTFLGGIASIRGMRGLRYEDLFPGSDCRGWHHYAVTWDTEGIASLPSAPQKALFVDGKLMPNAHNDIGNVEHAISIISNPTLLSFTHDPNRPSEFFTKCPFLIDEFKIWGYAKTDFNL